MLLRLIRRQYQTSYRGIHLGHDDLRPLAPNRRGKHEASGFSFSYLPPAAQLATHKKPRWIICFPRAMFPVITHSTAPRSRQYGGRSARIEGLGKAPAYEMREPLSMSYRHIPSRLPAQHSGNPARASGLECRAPVELVDGRGGPVAGATGASEGPNQHRGRMRVSSWRRALVCWLVVARRGMNRLHKQRAGVWFATRPIRR